MVADWHGGWEWVKCCKGVSHVMSCDCSGLGVARAEILKEVLFKLNLNSTSFCGFFFQYIYILFYLSFLPKREKWT